jgi:LmbE family N-acetylglucosaminyl deacetylase
MNPNIKKVLLLAPHPDDGEFGCGATLNKFIQNGATIRYVAFSPCEASVPHGLPKDILYKELSKATSKLGIKQKNITTFDFPVRYLSDHRQAILEELVKINREFKPDLVIAPNSKDIHQDHNTIHKEALRAFKMTRILGYELPWNDVAFENRFYVKLDRSNISRKIEAINQYESQSFRAYKEDEFFYSLGKMRGVQVGSEYAEAFEVIRWILD